MLILYHHNISVCAQKARIVLAEKDVPWEGRHIDLEAGENLRPEYLQIHPKGYVPALMHDGYTIIESTLICEYLDDVFADPPLKPKHPGAVARMRLWPKMVDDGLHFGIGAISHAAAFLPQLKTKYSVSEIEERLKRMPDKARSVRQIDLLHNGLNSHYVRDALRLYDKSIGEMEAALDHGPWLAGSDFSLADIAVIPYIERLDRLGLSQFWKSSRPKVGAWLDRMRARPSFKTAITNFRPVGIETDMLEAQGGMLWPQIEKILKE